MNRPTAVSLRALCALCALAALVGWPMPGTAQVSPHARVGEVTSNSEDAARIVRKILEKEINRVDRCGEKYLESKPKGPASVKLKIRLSPKEGAVLPLKNADMERPEVACVGRALAGLNWPKPSAKVDVVVELVLDHNGGVIGGTAVDEDDDDDDLDDEGEPSDEGRDLDLDEDDEEADLDEDDVLDDEDDEDDEDDFDEEDDLDLDEIDGDSPKKSKSGKASKGKDDDRRRREEAREAERRQEDEQAREEERRERDRARREAEAKDKERARRDQERAEKDAARDEKRQKDSERRPRDDDRDDDRDSGKSSVDWRNSRVGYAAISIDGDLKKKSVTEAIDGVLSKVDKEWRGAKAFHGMVRVEVEISSDGDVEGVSVVKSRDTDDCKRAIADAVEGIRFPETGDGEPATVTWTFALKR